MKSLRLCAAFLLLGSLLHSEEKLELSSDEFPRVPATEPEDALATFEVEPGFRLTLAAHEPEVMDPISMAFDEKGRAYVLEMRGYSERREEALGQVRLLTDTNGDGVFDQSSIFAKGLKWPTAILCYRGGVFVGATPDIHYLRDTDGDGVADETKHLFTGFGGGKLELNMQALFNSFRWGPDNRVWGATAPNGGTITKIGDSDFGPVQLRGADFSFDPELLDLRPENGTAQYGMSFDSKGRRFVCSNSRHLIWVAYERDQVKPNPWYRLPPALVDIPDDGAAAPVYRISPDEPWRIVRTRWRVSGVVKGIVEGGGRVSGYFTSATGVHLYWGDAFGDGFRDNAFIGDVGSNLVHRKLLVHPDNQTQPLGTRANPGSKTEFVRSSDNWFRPTSFASGPDGCLYITDMYRETIEHPWSLPEPIKKHVDLNSGFDRGRIYRVSPDDFETPEITDLSSLSDTELRTMTSHTNDWHQTTARRLLYERGLNVKKANQSSFATLLSSEKPLLDELKNHHTDKWRRAVGLNSLRTTDDLRAAISALSPLPASEVHLDLSRMIGRSGDPQLIFDLVVSTRHAPLDERLIAELSALRDGIIEGKGDWFSVIGRPELDESFRKAEDLLKATKSTNQERELAARYLALGAVENFQISFRDVFVRPDSPSKLRQILAGAITDKEFLAANFQQIPAQNRDELGASIVKDPNAATALLKAIQSDAVPLDTIPASVLNALRSHGTSKVAKQAADVLPQVISRESVLANYADALHSDGDPAKGKLAFTKVCQACHLSHEGEGIALGPAITTFATAGPESLLGNILDPNKEVAPQYQAYTFTMHSGGVFVGMIESEDAENVTLTMPGGLSKTFPRTDVSSMKGLGQSLMPEGMESSLSVEEMKDLLAYIATPPE